MDIVLLENNMYHAKMRLLAIWPIKQFNGTGMRENRDILALSINLQNDGHVAMLDWMKVIHMVMVVIVMNADATIVA